MKAIKTIFAVLFVSSMFIACEADTINEEVGVEEIDILGSEEDSDGNQVEDEG